MCFLCVIIYSEKMNDSSCLAEMTSLGCDHWQLQGEACAAVTKILQNEVMDLSKIPADLLQKVQIASGSKKVTHDEVNLYFHIIKNSRIQRFSFLSSHRI